MTEKQNLTNIIKIYILNCPQTSKKLSGPEGQQNMHTFFVWNEMKWNKNVRILVFLHFPMFHKHFKIIYIHSYFGKEILISYSTGEKGVR